MKKTLALVLCLVMVAACGLAGATTVGVSQLVQHPALDAATQGFQDAISEDLPEVNFKVLVASGDKATCATIANQLVADEMDLIMANGTDALNTVSQATTEIPILGTSITDYATALEVEGLAVGLPTGFNVSGTSDLVPLDQQAAMIVELFPEAKTVGLLYCSAESNSVYQIETIKVALEGMGLETKSYPFSDSNDLASVTQSAVGSVDVLYIPTDNTAAAATETIRNVVVPGGLPVVAGEEGIASGCGVAALTISYYNLGFATGKMAVRVLNGEDISAMPLENAPFTKKYNAEIAAELNVAIPDDYEAIAVE